VLVDEILALAPDWYREDSSRDPECEGAQEPGALAELRSMVADEAETMQFLASKGLVLSAETRERFWDAPVDELLAAFRVLERRALPMTAYRTSRRLTLRSHVFSMRVRSRCRYASRGRGIIEDPVVLASF
jgi:hypothetical protein